MTCVCVCVCVCVYNWVSLLYSRNQHSILFYFILVFCIFRVAPMAYGDSQARCLIRAIAAGLCQSHSNTRSKPRLRPTVQLMATLDPQSTERGQGLNHNLMVPSQICFCCAMMGTLAQHFKSTILLFFFLIKSLLRCVCIYPEEIKKAPWLTQTCSIFCLVYYFKDTSKQY